MSIRLGKALSQLNIGLQTAVDFLASKSELGYVEANLNFKINDAQWNALEKEFCRDFEIKKAVGNIINTLFRQNNNKTNMKTVKSSQTLNIVITGKSGAGKSSFLNYLIDENHFEVGEGSPVTQAYFEDYEYEVPDTHVTYHLYDTKGIEPTTTKECRQQIIQEIERRDKLSMFEWIHTIYYCFDASAKRIQPFEISFINELKNYVSIVILLTKKDLVSEIDLNSLISQIEEEIDTKVQIIPVCSVEKRTRRGISVREGKEDVLKASFLGLWEKMANSHPRKIVEFLLKKKDFSSDYKKNVIMSAETIQAQKEIDVVDVNRYKKAVNDKLSIEFLVNFPPIKNTDYRNISYLEEIIKEMMDITTNYIHDIFSRIDEMNIDAVWNENDKINRDIFSFYQKVNKVKPRVLYSNMAKDALLSIKTYKNKTAGHVKELRKIRKRIDEEYKDFRDTWFFDAEERLRISNCYDEYRDLVIRIGIELNLLINNFLSIYKAELIQYGQYCLKKNLKKENLEIIGSESELDNDEKTYYCVVQACLSNHLIEERERRMLEVLMEVLEISPTRAGLIEDFARKTDL